MGKTSIIAAAAAALCLGLAAESFSQSVPSVLSYQGVLTQPSGAVVPDGLYGLRFQIFRGPSDTTNVFDQTLTVDVRGGLYNVLLSGSQLQTAFSAPNAYMEVAIVSGGTPTVLKPRQQISSVPYAFAAASVPAPPPPVVEPWTSPSLAAPWARYTGGCGTPGCTPPSYYKDPASRVFLRGLVGGGQSGDTIFLLPPGYRPSYWEIQPCTTGQTSGGLWAARCDVKPTGEVIYYGSSAIWVSLDGMNFRAE